MREKGVQDVVTHRVANKGAASRCTKEVSTGHGESSGRVKRMHVRIKCRTANVHKSDCQKQSCKEYCYWGGKSRMMSCKSAGCLNNPRWT